MSVNWSPIWLSLRVAGLCLAVSAPAGVWLGHWLRGRNAAVLWVPMVLPPTIVCSYFLLPAFSWQIAVAAGTLYALPRTAFAARDAFNRLNRDYENAARSLGAPTWRIFWLVALPLTWRPILGAAAFAFARVSTEFAATLFIAQRLTGRMPLP